MIIELGREDPNKARTEVNEGHMATQKEIEAAAKAMLLRQTRNVNSLTWDQLPPQSWFGYLEDARVALEAAERIRELECREDRRDERRKGIASSNGRSSPAWH
jgi:hypothetical protein